MGELIPLFGSASDPARTVDEVGASRMPDVEEAAAYRIERIAPDPDRPVFAPIEESSLAALGRRQLSRRELERLLAKQGYEESAVADELDRLESVGLVDDTALAQHLVARAEDRKGLGGSAIKAELARRLIAPSAIDYAVDLIDTAAELDRARGLAASRARQYASLESAVAERRLSAFLMRRGFALSTVRAVVQEALRSA